MKKILIIAASVLVAGFLFSACQSAANGASPVTRDFTVSVGEGLTIAEVDEEDVLTGEFHRWEPNILVAFKGDTIRLTAENSHGDTHSLILDEFLVDTESLEAHGGTKTVEFTADKAGIFQFACGLEYEDEDTGELTGDCAPDHEAMVGYLIVLDR